MRLAAGRGSQSKTIWPVSLDASPLIDSSSELLVTLTVPRYL